MAATASQVVTIIADDLTGACDTGCLFAGPGPGRRPRRARAHRPRRLRPDARDRDRHREPRPAVPGGRRRDSRRRRDPCGGRLAEGRVFKKIDSTLRGAAGVELTALLEHGPPFTGALVCPAFPAQRRVVRDGRLLVDSVPVHESAIARDPAFRGATSDVAALLAGGAARGPARARRRPRRRREGRAPARASPGRPRGRRRGDRRRTWRRLAEAALAAPGTLIAGSAGLGRALSRALGCEAPAVALPPGRARLVVVGSLHPASRAQLDALRAAGVPLVTADARGHGDPAPAVAALAAGRGALVASATTPADRETIARAPGRGGRAHPRARRARISSRSPAATPPTRCSARSAPRRFDLAGAPARRAGPRPPRPRGTTAAPSRCSPRRADSAPPISSPRSWERPA